MRRPHCARATLLLAAALLAAMPAPQAAEALPLADESAGPARPAAGALARRPDERRPESSRELDIFGQRVSIGGEWEIAHESRRNLDLDHRRARDRSRLDQELKLEAQFAPAPGTRVFLQLVGLSEIETQRQGGDRQSRGTLERGQMWLYRERPGGLPADLQIGRVGLVEARSWWWDEDLDALRLIAGGPDWLVDTGFARQLVPVSSDDSGNAAAEDGVLRWFGRAAWSWRKRHTLEAYWLLARDRSGRPAPGRRLAERRADPSDADLDWLGLRAIGEARSEGGQRLGYWLDLAHVGGHERRTAFTDTADGRVQAGASRRERVSAVGWDLGARWSLPGEARPTLWAGWAVGSGDREAGDGRDHAFRQTGLEENKARFGGVKRFRYYGELMRPTLSNLDIRSLGASLRFLERSSADLVLHDYRQRQASTRLADSRLDLEPAGLRRGLGHELDLFLAFRESPRVEYFATLAAFRAGPAFGRREGEQAWFVELGVTLNF